MYGPQHCADEFQGVAKVHSEMIVHAQQTHAPGGDQGANPRWPADALPPADQRHHRHQDHVQSRQEARIAGGRGLHARLLTDQGAHQQRSGDRRPAEKVSGRQTERPHPGQQDHRTQQEPQAVEEKGPQAGLGSQALRHEGDFPRAARRAEAARRRGIEGQAMGGRLGHSIFRSYSTTNTGLPKTPIFGTVPRPGRVPAAIRPLTRCGAPSAVLTVT